MRGNTFRKRPRSKKRGVKQNKSKKKLKKLMRGGRLEICHFGPNGTITTTKGSDGNVYTLNQLNDHEYETIKTQINILMAFKLEDLEPHHIVPLKDSLMLIYVAIDNIISNYNFIHLKKHFNVPIKEINSKIDRCKKSLASIFENLQDIKLTDEEFEEIKSDEYKSFFDYLEKLGKKLNADLEQLNAELAQLDERRQQLYAELAQSNAQIEQLDARRKQLTDYRQELNKQLPTLYVWQRKQLIDQITQLNEELGLSNADIAQLNTQLAQLSPQLAPLNTQIEQLNTQIKELNETQTIWANLINRIDLLK
jgi:DNA repair exonuclease SbcCD ATPase subunit